MIGCFCGGIIEVAIGLLGLATFAFGCSQSKRHPPQDGLGGGK